jgi:protein SCO1/2
MAGMTMPYNVHDPKQLDGIVPGDLINAKLIVLSNDAYLTDVRKVGQAPLPKAPADVPAPSASSGFELLKPGEAVPDTQFVDQDGKKRTFEAFKGTPVLVTFIYTKCPMPAFCPLMDQHFAAIQKKLKDDPALKGHVHLVSVSFDPITDTPAVLKLHATKLGADLHTWTFLTGDRDEIDKFASRFGVSVARSQADQRDITHNLRTAIVDADGKLVKVYVGNEWTPDQALADLAPVVRAN